MAAMLDKELRGKYGMRNIEVRKGDEVKIMRGKFKGKSGKVASVEVKKTRISIDGVQKPKKDGTKILVPLEPTNLMITELNLDDKKRKERLTKKGE